MHLESRGLAAGTVNLRLAAIRRLAYEAADAGRLSPEQAAGIRRVKGAKKLGVRAGNWLLANEARALWELPDAKTLKGKRDRAILSLLLACGLRLLLGHVSVQTTEKYLGCKQRIQNAVNDRIGIEPSS